MADPRPTNTGFYLPFGQALTSFRNALADQGIQTNIISGVRSPEEHQMAWDNFLAGKGPLPHPEFGPVSRATPPGEVSTHDVGLGADVQPVNRADLPRMYAMAPKFGIDYLGASDPYHFQMANWRQVAATEPPQMPWTQAVAEAQRNRQQGDFPTQYASNVSASGGPAGNGFTPPGTTITSRPSTPTPGTPVNDFYHTAMMHESGGKNIPNAAGGAAGGYYQFTPPTWTSVRAAHPELNLPANAMDANLDQQTAAYHALVNQNVTALQAANLPINDKNVFMASFLGGGGATKFLSAMKDNPTASAADLFPAEAKANPTVFYSGGKPRSLTDVYALQTKNFGAANTTGFGPDASAAPAVAAGATGTAAGGAGGTAMGFQTQAGEDAFLKAAKGFQKATGGGGDAQGQGGPPDIQQSPMVGPPSSAQNVSPLLAMVPMTYGQTINSLQDPLTWNSNPPGRPPPMPQPGAGVGRQGPMGTSLNSMAMMDPNMAQFPQSPITGMGYMGMGYGYPGGGMPYG